MKALGIDYGLKRVGLALCDPEGILAWPLATFAWTTREELFGHILEAIRTEGVQAVVVGLPPLPGWTGNRGEPQVRQLRQEP